MGQEKIPCGLQKVWNPSMGTWKAWAGTSQPGSLLQHEGSVLTCLQTPLSLAGLSLLGTQPGVCLGPGAGPYQVRQPVWAAAAVPPTLTCGSFLRAGGPSSLLVMLKGSSPEPHPVPLPPPSFRDTQPSAHSLVGCVASDRSPNLSGRGFLGSPPGRETGV